MQSTQSWRIIGLLSLFAIAFATDVTVAQETVAQNTLAQNTLAQQAVETVADSATESDWMDKVDSFFGYLVDWMAMVLFFDFGTGKLLGEGRSIPFVVAWMMIGATFFTIKMGFINVRGFYHALRVTKGDYDDPADVGDVTHFQALCSALSATIGLGNIAGVAIAVGTGGPGAILWMVLAGLLGMTSKFAECTLAQIYRHVGEDGRIHGGPMRYLKQGLAEMGLGPLGAVLGILFTILCIGGSFGGGCAFQVVQSLGIVQDQIPVFQTYPWLYGAIMAFLVGIVILGGITRIARTAEKIVPIMCVLYTIMAITILVMNANKIGWAFGEIFHGAFTGEGIVGGMVGVMVIGIKRAAFSNEAGVGSAAIAHSAAKTDHPVREGIVALLGPFIDTVVICTMTGLVIVITGAYDNPEFAPLIAGDEGAQLTGAAFGSQIEWFPIVLTVAVFFFAYSTMISWSYYGERCWTHLFGPKSSFSYKIVFLIAVFLGSIITAENVLVFSDLMILSMALPNILGVMLLSGKARSALDTYWKQYKSGEFKTFN